MNSVKEFYYLLVAFVVINDYAFVSVLMHLINTFDLFHNVFSEWFFSVISLTGIPCLSILLVSLSPYQVVEVSLLSRTL